MWRHLVLKSSLPFGSEVFPQLQDALSVAQIGPAKLCKRTIGFQPNVSKERQDTPKKFSTPSQIIALRRSFHPWVGTSGFGTLLWVGELTLFDPRTSSPLRQPETTDPRSARVWRLLLAAARAQRRLQPAAVQLAAGLRLADPVRRTRCGGESEGGGGV